MTSWFRRAGQELARIIKSAANPAAEAGHVVGFAKDVGGVAQFFARSPDFARQVSGTGCNIFDKPLTAHALDDEFDSTVLAPAWTLTNYAAGAINPYGNPGGVYELHTQRRPSWIMLQGANASFGLVSKDITSIAGSNFFVWMRGSFNARAAVAPVNNDSNLGIDLLTVAGNLNDRVGMQINETDNVAPFRAAQFDRVVAGVGTVVSNTRDLWSGAQLALQPIEAVGIQKIGTTYHGWAFSRCGSAIYMGSQVYAAAITTLAIRTEITSAAAPGTMILGVDFVRFKDGATYLP